ncbi:restriction endonuclease subunit S [Aliarcobacter butzleri]|uniref:restriction endonuclease subunit S n=1 Tax=Aliarcobacter butzleri TaxID=28197 RepID=UPI001EDA1052|nr:restriction endonuclease subunit S [Aliarcobacter butzleri]MCG3654866.1 restriction endonuclease subunit S [Aliarcobacter butzleri]
MSKIHFERFDKLLKFLPKSKIKAGDGLDSGKYPFFTSSATLSKFIDTFNYEDESLIFGSGGNASIHYCNQKFATSTDCFVVNQDSEDIDVKYVYYYLKSNIRLIEDGFKGAGLKHISKKYISEIKIPLLPLEDQQKIAQQLSQIEALINKREESIKLLDELTKSTFLDMLGDPVLNPKRFGTKTIEQLVKKERHAIKRGPFGGALKKEIFVEDGYLVYEQFHALNNDFTMARYFIGEEKFKELEGFEVKSGDIIISCSGVYLGKLAIVPPNARKGIINQALLKVTLDETKMNNILFTHIFTNENFKNKYFGSSRGAGIPNFPPMSDFKKFEFIAPSKPLQDKFAEIVTQIEQTKTIYQNSLIELNNLFGSIAQKAFKGELNVSKIELIQKEQEEITMSIKLDGYRLLEEIKKGDFEASKYVNEHQNYDAIKDMIFKLIEDGKISQKFDDNSKKIILEAE